MTVVIPALLTALNLNAAPETKTATIAGFGKVKFGASAADVQRLMPTAAVSGTVIRVPLGVPLEAGDAAHLTALTYAMIRLREDKVWSILVSMEGSEVSADAYGRFLEHFRDRLGEPDVLRFGATIGTAVWKRGDTYLELKFDATEPKPRDRVLTARFEAAKYAPETFEAPEIPVAPPPEPEPPPLPEPRKFKSGAAAVTVWDTSLLHQESEYGRQQVALCLHFENKTNTRLIGVVTKTTITNAFGKQIYQGVHENELSLASGARERNDTCWIYPDNPFIQNEAYDRMWKAAHDATATVKVQVVKAVFEGGIVIGR